MSSSLDSILITYTFICIHSPVSMYTLFPVNPHIQPAVCCTGVRNDGRSLCVLFLSDNEIMERLGVCFLSTIVVPKGEEG